MILALLLAAAPVPSAAAPLTADTAEAQAAAQKSRILWGIGGNLRLKAGDAATAAKDFDQGLAIPGGTALERGELLLDRARAAQSSGDLATADARSAEAARLIPGDPFLWYFRATLAVAASDVPRAKIAIARALALAPGDPTILFESAMSPASPERMPPRERRGRRRSPPTPTAPPADAPAKHWGLPMCR